MDKAQALALTYRDEVHYGRCIVHVGPKGGERLEQERWRVNGQAKTWVTRPDEFSVPIKHGMRDFAYLDHTNADQFHAAATCEPERR